MKRDLQLDSYRALAMLYIVCVIHIVYWFHVGNEPVRSAILFEMPVIFFIAGASQSVRKTTDNLIQTLVNRTKRLLIPFYVFLFVLLFLVALYRLLQKSSPLLPFSTGELIKMLCTGGNEQIPYFGYTWFISCYMMIGCSLPLQRKIFNHMPNGLYLLLAVAVFIIVSLIPLRTGNLEIKNIFVYNVFFLMGYFYYHRIPRKKLLFAFPAAVLICVAGFLTEWFIPMQDHKFPADACFLLYGTCAVIVLSTLFSHVTLPYNAILKLWNERGYTIYLYQSVSHFLLYKITNDWIARLSSPGLTFIVYFILIFILTTTLSFVTYPLERKVMNVFNHLVSDSRHEKNS